MTMERLVKTMASVSSELIDAEKRFDAMVSCSELSREDMVLMNELMPRANALAGEFKAMASEEIKKNSTEYGMLLARILCTEKAFMDVVNLRCKKGEFEALTEMAKKEFRVQDEPEDDEFGGVVSEGPKVGRRA